MTIPELTDKYFDRTFWVLKDDKGYLEGFNNILQSLKSTKDIYNFYGRLITNSETLFRFYVRNNQYSFVYTIRDAFMNLDSFIPSMNVFIYICASIACNILESYFTGNFYSLDLTNLVTCKFNTKGG